MFDSLVIVVTVTHQNKAIPIPSPVRERHPNIVNNVVVVVRDQWRMNCELN